MKGKSTCFVESSDSDVKKKKLISSDATDSTKTLTKFTVNARYESLLEGYVKEEGGREGYINSPLSGLLVCRLVMICKRLSTNFTFASVASFSATY